MKLTHGPLPGAGLISLAAFAVLVFACGPSDVGSSLHHEESAEYSVEQPVRPSGDRRFGVAIFDTPAQDYADALASSKAAGSDHIEVVIGWDDVETAPGKFNPETDWAEIANDVYGCEGLSIALSFLTVDTLDDRRPAWRQGSAWDDPQNTEAAWAALSRTLGKFESSTLLNLSLGNEANIALAGQEKSQVAYISFVAALRARVKNRYPELPVGVKVSAEDILKGNLDFAQAVTRGMDIAMVTYYPLDDRAVVREPTVPASDFEAIVGAFPDHPIHLAEIGYPSSESCGSSQAKQATFVRSAFAAWDDQAERIVRLNWTWQTDIPPRAARDYAASLGGDGCFAEFLATLGLRDHRAQPKLAWLALNGEAKARGFGVSRSPNGVPAASQLQ